MNYTAPGIAVHPEPRHNALKRSQVALPEPGAARPPIQAPAPRRSLPRVLAALTVRRRWRGPPHPRERASAGSGVTPVASGATRGVAFLINR